MRRSELRLQVTQRHRHGHAGLTDTERGIGEFRWPEADPGVAAESDALLRHAEQGILQPPDAGFVMINRSSPHADRYAGYTYRERADASRRFAMVGARAVRKVGLVADRDEDVATIVADAGHGDIDVGGRGRHYWYHNRAAHCRPPSERHTATCSAGSGAAVKSLSRLSAAIQPDISTIGMPGPG